MDNAVKRWNAETRAYEPYPIPKSWNVSIYSDHMDKIITCAGCGRDIRFGDGYCSMEIHNFVGFGYSVCANCHWEEMKRVYNGKW